jgi:hypothetical protein
MGAVFSGITGAGGAVAGGSGGIFDSVKGLASGMSTPPPPALDAADKAVRAAAAAERRRAMAGAGQQSTFLSGLTPDSSMPAPGPKSLLGS